MGAIEAGWGGGVPTREGGGRGAYQRPLMDCTFPLRMLLLHT